MEKITRITLNKNRGWRGLAELLAEDKERKQVTKMIFSFSQEVWDDMLRGVIVTQDIDHFIVLFFDNTDELPRPYQQRSVLIKSFNATVVSQYEYPKDNWKANAPSDHYLYISHFIKNKNNHTQSDWNCIGMRVIPTI